MTTFIKTKFKILDDQMNINKYRLAANITEYHIISKLILQRISITNCFGGVEIFFFWKMKEEFHCELGWSKIGYLLP